MRLVCHSIWALGRPRGSAPISGAAELPQHLCNKLQMPWAAFTGPVTGGRSLGRSRAILHAVKASAFVRAHQMQLLARFAKDESGATAIEYGLIAALIAVGIIIAATTLGGSLSDLFNRISGKLNTAT
jgi:pilus assembly protein Flp/PilA